MKRRQPSSRVKLDHHKVWELLNRLNMTQNELARLVGTSSGYLSQLMSGTRCPSADIRKRLMEALGVTRYTWTCSSWSRSMCSEGPATSAPLLIPPGVALMPDEFPERLEAVRELFDLNCEEMAVALGVDPRQLMRWRIKGRAPNSGAMLALVRLAIRSPEGLAALLDEDVIVIFKPRRSEYGN